MKLEDVEMNHVRRFLTWYKEMMKDCPFTKKGLWEIQKECWTADLEVYWDGNSYLSDDQVQKIFDDGLEGYHALYEELWDFNWDHTSDIKDAFIENIDIDASMLSESFKTAIMETWECDEDEVAEHAADELKEFIRENFQEELDVDLNFDELLKNTPGEVYVDNEEIHLYDLLDTDKLDLVKLLFSTMRSPTSETEKEMYEGELGIGCTCLEDLDDDVGLSLCIADSLDEYVNMLAEAEKNKTGDKPAELYYMAKKGEVYFDMDRDSLCLSSEPNFDTHDFEVEFMDLETFKKTKDFFFDDYYAFCTFFEDVLFCMADKVLTKEMTSPVWYEWRDSEGRSLIHYAIYLGKFAEIVERIVDDEAHYLLYTKDNHGISPLSLILVLWGMDPDESLRDTDTSKKEIEAFFDLAYLDVLDELPRRNETSLSWETASILQGEINDKKFYVVECRLEQHLPSIDKDEYAPDLDLLCIDVENGSYLWNPIENFDNLLPLRVPVEIRLDGTIAA